MLVTYDIIRGIIPFFNEREITDETVFSLVDQRKIDFNEMKLKRPGYHVWYEGEDYIFIKKSLRGLQWLESVVHELIHALISVPLKFMYEKQQLEAKVLTVIALIPQYLLNDKWRFLEENPTPFAYQLFKERERIFFFYGV